VLLDGWSSALPFALLQAQLPHDASAYSVLRDFGFPALVTAFVLVRVESRLSQLTRSVELLTRVLIRQGLRLPNHEDTE
jgi:YvrJ-like protein